ncbi:LuxR C-terminal-related transcriptional regulator [Actinomadura syzygii]|uniref:Helix-turn-helix transcriptional regulator n=1 Tax=Actinomadura syzygii TaxID=1427538 RepID=A0A5D0TRZ4_9ACTN|nr:LuxR C-terminal-related transcriptional regulator [Actinomadura syzygii]TYC08617.1 helix-turn-helix transcriptional regulator [Actinomadura syzygii]
MLESLGLDASAEAVYIAMLTNPDMGVTALAAHLALDVSEVRNALGHLADLALLRPSREFPGTLRPVNPEAGLMALVHQQQADLLRRQQEVAVAQAAIARMVADNRDTDVGTSHPGVERLIGLDAIQTRLEGLARVSSTECLSVMPGGGQKAETLEASRTLDEEALDRGVAIRTLYQDSVRNDSNTVAYAQRLAELGGEVRTAPVLPARMLIIDRRLALLPLDPKDSSKGAMQVDSPGIVSALITLFEHIWEVATPIGEATRPDGVTGLTPLESELIRLLAQGLTDEAAAKHLGVSSRTVARMMADLMKRLAATSRFQAGAKAAQQRWI